MSKYLVSSTEIYRVDSRNEVDDIIAKAEEQSSGKAPKVAHEYKERKQKGEVVDAWWRVSITSYFNDEKEPMDTIDVKYEKGSVF